MTARGSAPAGGARAAGILLGFALDAAFADPQRFHPVAGFGAYASWLEGRLYRPAKVRGAVFTAAALSAPVALGIVAERLSGRPAEGSVSQTGTQAGTHAGTRRAGTAAAGRVAVTAVATWAALGGTSLAREGTAMARSLESEDLPAARARLSHLCARDPAALGPGELARATVESLAENTSDAVVAPLLWAAVAGVPGVLGYRAANTLDAMVGYRSERYRWFGWAPARLDDVLNLVPARVTGVLTVACAPLVGARPGWVWQVMSRDAANHPSPNAGWCEAPAAAALGVQLGGANVYGGQAEVRPALGAGGRAVEVPDIRRAVRLGQSVSVAGAITAAGVALLAARLTRPRRSAAQRPGRAGQREGRR